MIAVPERLEDAVGEAQHQDVLDRFFAEEVIDPIDLVFGQHLEDLRVEGLGRRKVVPERLFDDHSPPRSLRLPVEPCAAELLDHRAEEPLGDRQIEQHIGSIGLPLARIHQQLPELGIGIRLRKVSTHVTHAADEPRPGLFVDRRGLLLVPADARERLHHLGQTLAPLFRGLVVVIDADDGEFVGKLSGTHEIVERRHDKTLGQIAACAKNRQGRGGRPMAGKGRCRGRRGFRRDRGYRIHRATR